jgi:hypothetical protein
MARPKNLRKHDVLPEQRLVRNEQTGCLEWSGCKTKKGYGAVSVGNRPVLVHRYFYEKWIGRIPEGLNVCHRCDNPSCAEPSHLFIGTNADNTADMVEKHRQACGERHGMAKLTLADVAAIRSARAAGGKVREVAKQFKISIGTVSMIANRQIWTDSNPAA